MLPGSFSKVYIRGFRSEFERYISLDKVVCYFENDLPRMLSVPCFSYYDRGVLDEIIKRIEDSLHWEALLLPCSGVVALDDTWHGSVIFEPRRGGPPTAPVELMSCFLTQLFLRDPLPSPGPPYRPAPRGRWAIGEPYRMHLS